MTAQVGSAARALGFAGLLPQVAAVGVIALAQGTASDAISAFVGTAVAVAIGYPLFILSFLGGIWWGLAMQQTARQGATAAVAVMPSLLALALLGFLSATEHFGWTLVLIGSALVATLVVDRRLVVLGIAPAEWMRLRIPLSVGLGVLTIVAGITIGGPVVRY